MKKVSIITVCYNAVDTIEQTIHSIIEQTYGIDNIEYIIIDGKSIDGTVDIIKKYQPYISYFISEPDNGIYDAMNKGISVATGEVIGILNADDWYEVDAIRSIMDCFEATKVQIVYGEMKRVEKDGTVSKVKKVDSLTDTWYLMTIWHPATFVKKEVYDELGSFSTDYEIAADYEFILRCYSNDVRFTYLDKELTYFRSAGVSNTKHIKCAEETSKIALKYIDKAPDKQRVLDENNYRLKSAIFKQKCDTNPQVVITAIPQVDNNKIVVWGTGIWGRAIVKMLKSAGLQLEYLVDTDKQKEGKYLLETEIKNCQALKESDVFVIVAIRRINSDVKDKLDELGIGRERYIFLEEWMTIVAEKENV